MVSSNIYDPVYLTIHHMTRNKYNCLPFVMSHIFCGQLVSEQNFENVALVLSNVPGKSVLTFTRRHCLVIGILIKSFLAHLAFRPCELLPSLFVRRPSVNISHFNLLLRNQWAKCNQTLVEWPLGGPFQNCVRWSRLPTKMAAKLKIDKKEYETLRKNSSLKLLSQSQPNFVKWSLGGPLSK